MQYTTYEILFFFFAYSFLGWALEVLVMAFRTGKICNRGMLSLPLCPPYGLAMVILAVGIPTLKEHYLAQAVGYMIVTMSCMEISGAASVIVSGTNIWEAEKRSVLSGTWKGRGLAVLIAVGAWLLVSLVHPFTFILTQLIPAVILKWSMRVLTAVTAVDMVAVGSMARFGKKSRASIANRSDRRWKLPSTENGPKEPRNLPSTENGQEEQPKLSPMEKELEEQKNSLARRLVDHFWRRMKKAYPHLELGDAQTMEKEAEAQKLVFAKGLCVHKLIWVFLISSLCGDIIETFYVRAVSGVWMSRSSVLYGPFSVVWGIGATLLTMMLYNLREKEDRYIFIGGFFVGGTYEYMASLVLEKLLGTRFWDYSDMPFNLNGRTNLLYCIFWGLLGVFWIKIVYPRMSAVIEKLRPIPGVIITWVLVAAMIADLAVSGLAILRYVERKNSVSAGSAFEEFLDDWYPDSLIDRTWPNLKIQEKSS